MKPITNNQSVIERLDGSKISAGEIEIVVNRLIKAARVPAIAIAIINNNQIGYINGFGFSNKAEQQSLNLDTIMYGASFTKAVFAYFVLQLVESGQVDLDRPVYQYLPQPLPNYHKYQDLAEDLRYQLITAGMLLSHTSGLPNWRWLNSDEKLDIKFTPGSQYSYSGEGINLLQFVIEEITRKSIIPMMQESIFTPFAMTRTSLIWQDSFLDNLAIGYDKDERPLDHRRRTSARAAGSMDTTIHDFARFITVVMQGRGLKPETKNLMLTPQIEIFSKHQFPTPSRETTDQYSNIQLAYGLGWGLLHSPYGKAYFKEGHDDGWQNYVICFDEKGIALILMSNSSNGESIFKELLDVLIKDTFTPWQWQGYIPYGINADY